MKFFDLPQFIIQHIFEYDSTYYQLFKKMVYCEIDKTYKRQFYEIINNDIVVIDADFDNEFSYGLNTCFRKYSICKIFFFFQFRFTYIKHYRQRRPTTTFYQFELK